MKEVILLKSTRGNPGDIYQNQAPLTSQKDKVFVCFFLKPPKPFKELLQAERTALCLLVSAAAETQWQQSPDLRDFLVQSSDEEDVGCLELSDPQLDSEAEVMAYFQKNQTVPAKYSSSSCPSCCS